MTPAADLEVQLLRLGAPGSERPAVRHGDVTYDLTPLTADIDGAFLADDGIARARQALASRDITTLDPAVLRLGPPVARPQCLLCMGLCPRVSGLVPRV